MTREMLVLVRPSKAKALIVTVARTEPRFWMIIVVSQLFASFENHGTLTCADPRLGAT